MNIKKSIFLSLMIAAGCVPFMHAEKAWHMVIGCEKVPVNEIDYAINQEGTEGYDVVLLDGSTVHGVTRATFEYAELAGTALRLIDRETVIGPYSGYIAVKGLPEGASLAIYDSMGHRVLSATSEGESCRMDISQLAPGIYVLKTPRSAVKFRKD